jgi:acyl-CoA thioesterase
VGILHGGITYSIADAAFAYAANTHNRIAVALDVTMSYPNAGYVGDELNVEATEVYLGDKTAIYRVTVLNQKKELLGIFNGTVYRRKQRYFEEESNP